MRHTSSAFLVAYLLDVAEPKPFWLALILPENDRGKVFDKFAKPSFKAVKSG